MRKTVFLSLIAILLLPACAFHSYLQVYETKPTQPIHLAGNDYVFENDTLRISYNFWGEGGFLNFTVYNKLNTPLYIDWKKSSFIRNGKTVEYWPDNHQFFVVGASNAVSNDSVAKRIFSVRPDKEQITRIEPKQTFTPAYKQPLYTTRGTLLNTNRNYQVVYGKDHNGEEVKSKLYMAEYDSSNNVFNFRNVLAMSTSPKFEGKFYADNGFYVSKIYEMDKTAFSTNYQQPGNFIIDLYPTNTIEHRKHFGD